MIVWPGWNKSSSYFNGSLSFKDWYEKMRQYLMFQLNHIIRHEDKYRTAVEPDTLSKVDKGQITTVVKKMSTDQTQYKPDNEIGIEICGPPSYLNNLVFYECSSK